MFLKSRYKERKKKAKIIVGSYGQKKKKSANVGNGYSE